MACSYPLTAYQCSDGGIVFDETRKSDITRTLLLPCGQCARCRLEKSRQWAVRCLHEASLHEHNSFITLTYNTEHLPPANNLTYRDWQLFMKRLLQAVRRETKALSSSNLADSIQSGNAQGTNGEPTPPRFATTLDATMRANIRFYMAGEYGERHGRPHFHACLFNLDFLDKTEIKTTKSGHKIYTSPTLEKLWPYGFSSIGNVTFQSAAYIARYIMTKTTESKATPVHIRDRAKQEYQHINSETGEITNRKKEFNNMSRKPGIAKNWIIKYTSDVYPEGKMVVNATKQNPPRYYDNYFKNLDPLGFEQLQHFRELEALATAHDNTDARRHTKEQVTLAKLQHYKRELK